MSLSWFNFCEKVRFNSWFSVQAGKKEAILLKDAQFNTCLPYSPVDLLKRKVLLCFTCILIGCCQQSCLVHTFRPAASKISCRIHHSCPKGNFPGNTVVCAGVCCPSEQHSPEWLVCTIPRESSLVKVSSCTAGSACNDRESPRIFSYALCNGVVD